MRADYSWNPLVASSPEKLYYTTPGGIGQRTAFEKGVAKQSDGCFFVWNGHGQGEL